MILTTLTVVDDRRIELAGAPFWSAHWARLESDDGRPQILLPLHAVGEDRQGRYVFVLDGSDEPGVGIVHRRSIQIEPDPTPEGLEVLQGLTEGELVVTAGVRRLVDGQRVKHTESAP